MKTKVYNSFKEFLNDPDLKVNGVTKNFAILYSNYAEMNKTNEGCFNCKHCLDCVYCHDCSYCTGCKGCFLCKNCDNLKDEDFKNIVS